ncbi:MAG: hypothetical protein ACI4U3_06565 [Traorella sp.]
MKEAFRQNKMYLDFLFKKIFSKKIFLAIFMKETLREYRNYDVKMIMDEFIEGHIEFDKPLPSIIGQNTELNLDNKQTRFDILFYALLPASDKKIGLIINLEFQNNFYVGYSCLKRGHYYNSRNISNQFETIIEHGNYDALVKVASIWFLFNPTKEKQNSINSYRMIENNIVGNVHENEEEYDMSEIVMVYLGSGNSDNGLIDLMNQFKESCYNVDGINHYINEKYHVTFDENDKKEMKEMFSYSEYITQKSIELGKEQGIELGKKQGKEQGIELGKESNIVMMIRNKMKKRNLSVQEAIEQLDLDEHDISYYLDLLKKYE